MKKICFLLLTTLLGMLTGKLHAQWSLTGNSNATATSVLGTTNAFPLNLTTNNVNRMTITSAGRIGVGITSPVNIFSIKGSGGSPAASWVSAGAPLFTGFGEQTVGNADYILSMASSLSNARPVYTARRSRGPLAIPTALANNDFIMSFLSSGYDGSAFQNPAGIDFYVDGTPTAGNVPARISFVTGTNSSTRAERLKILSGGDVSITTGNLSVAKYVTVKGMLSANGGVDSAYAITANGDSTHGGLMVKDPKSKSVLYSIKSGTSAGVYVEKTSLTTGTGSLVGVGSGSGSGVDAYSVYNDALYAYSDSGRGVYSFCAGSTGIYGETGDTTNYYAGYFNGDAYASNYYQSSDAKLKNNIKSLENAMEIIGSLQPKNYYFNKDGNFEQMNLPRGLHYGLIAQDVEKVLPNLVKDSKVYLRSNKKKDAINDNGFNRGELMEFKAVNYTELIPIMIKGMQEQTEKAAQQAAKIQQQDDVIKQQNDKINALIALVEKISPGAKAVVNNVKLSSAALEQNIPNPPVNNLTKISYNIPAGAVKAEMFISDNSGKKVKQINLNNNGKGLLNVDTTDLAAGTYSYTLVVDGKVIDTKKMVVLSH